MPDIESFSPRGMFHEGWTAEVNDYAIVCGWATKGKLFIVGDVAGGIFAFEGDTGKIIWKKENTHSAGLLAMSIHPEGEIFATSGQDGNIQIYNWHISSLVSICNRITGIINIIIITLICFWVSFLFFGNSSYEIINNF